MSGAEFEPGAKLGRWEEHLTRPEAALKQIGAMMTAESQQAFRDQKFGDKAWAPRSVPNVMGIIADFAAGKKNPPARRFESRPAMVDTASMRNSIAFRLVSQQVVEVGVNRPQANVLHAGGAIESKPIDERVRQGLMAWFKGQGKQWRSRLGWLLNPKFAGQTLKSKVPARPMVGVTKQTIEDVQDAVGLRIMEVK